MAIERLIRSSLDKVAKRFGYRLMKDSPLLWTLPSINLRTPWTRRLSAEAPVRTVFDVGANDGKSVTWLRKAFGDATIYSFEPFGPSYERLRTNVAGDPRVLPINLALGDRQERSTYHANSSPGTGSLLPNAARIAEYSPAHMVVPVGTMEVGVDRIDHFCSDRAIERIDVLKVDAQGYERHILAGAGDMLNPDTIRGIMLEVLFVDLYDGQAWPDELMAMLRERGYRLFGFSGVNYSLENGWHWADAFFVKA